MEALYYILAGLIVIGTFIPEWDNDYWLVRSQEYIKTFYLSSNILLAILIYSKLPHDFYSFTAISILVLAAVYCFFRIFPFLQIASISIKKVASSNHAFKLFIFNVYQYNEEYAKLVNEVKKENPDIVFLVETNQKWEDGLRELDKIYPYSLREIKEDTYGMMMLSKFPMQESNVRTKVKPKIPSMYMELKVNERTVHLFGIHPKPPILGESLSSKPKDKELMSVAQEIVKLPSDDVILLIGDFNDVAWSKISKKFKRLTKMVDPREGRGFYATFPAYSPIRIPLDHIFCSNNISLIDFRTLKNIGSDHLPVFVSFDLT